MLRRLQSTSGISSRRKSHHETKVVVLRLLLAMSMLPIAEQFMLKNIDLTREIPKAEYKGLKAEADLKLAALQRQAKALGIPIIVVFEGWSAAGKGTLINELILPLDPRGFSVYSARGPT